MREARQLDINLGKRSVVSAMRLGRKAGSKARIVRNRFIDQVHFVGALVQNPRQTGAIAPTSAELADAMAAHVSADRVLPVLELGPGTGAITAAILRRGVPPAELIAVEYEKRFCTQLARTFPGLAVINGNAFDLDTTLAALDSRTFDCVISGLPLLNFPQELRRKMLADVLDRLSPGRPFVQFSYGVVPPVETTDPAVTVQRSRWIWRNLPPARVWTYTRP